MSSLRSVPVGARARVTAVAEQPLLVRMASMGLRPGVELQVLARAASGSRIVRVGDARLTLARELVAVIDVDTAPESADVQ